MIATVGRGVSRLGGDVAEATGQVHTGGHQRELLKVTRRPSFLPLGTLESLRRQVSPSFDDEIQSIVLWIAEH